MRSCGYRPITRYGAETSIFGPQHKIQSFALAQAAAGARDRSHRHPAQAPGFHIVEVASPRLGESLMARSSPIMCAPPRWSPISRCISSRDANPRWCGSARWIPASRWKMSMSRCATAPGPSMRRAGPTRRACCASTRSCRRPIRLPGCLNKWDRQYYVTAYKDGDFCFVLSNWGEGISTWRFNLYQNHWQGPYIAHAVLDRSLLRAGETVAMKLIVRKKSRRFCLRRQDKAGQRSHPAPSGQRGRNQAAGEMGPARASRSSATRFPRRPSRVSTRSWSRNSLSGRNDERLEAGSFRVAAYRVPTMRAA